MKESGLELVALFGLIPCPDEFLLNAFSVCNVRDKSFEGNQLIPLIVAAPSFPDPFFASG